MKHIWRNKWFYLITGIAIFWLASYVRIAYAGTDVQLDKILKAATDGLIEYFKFLLDVLNKVW